MLTTSFYLLLTISIVTKCIDCYVMMDNNAENRIVAKSYSQADNRRRDFIGNDSNSNHMDINTTTANITTAVDNAATIMPKSNEEVTDDYSTWKTVNDDDNMTSGIETGRKKYPIKYQKVGKYGKIGKKKKYTKFLYPVLIGIFITKMIMFPLFVKAVTILSSAAFMFSKMSLLASLVLGLKFFLSNNYQNNDSKVEIVHVPLKKYGGSDWDRETSETRLHNVIADNIYAPDLRPTRFVLPAK